MYITLRIIPDRDIRNYSNISLVKEVSDLYASPLDRLNIKARRIEKIEFGMFDIIYKAEDVSYYFSAPSHLEDQVRHKIRVAWPHSLIEDSKLEMEESKYEVGEIKSFRHNVFSLSTDTRDNDPMTSQLAVLESLRKDDVIRVNIQLIPMNRLDWQDYTYSARESIRSGILPLRRSLNQLSPFKLAAYGIEGLFRQLAEFTLEIMEGQEAIKQKKPRDPELQAIMTNGRLSPDTLYKTSSNVFKTIITIISYSPNDNRAKSNLKCVADSFKDLDLDNKVYLRKIMGREKRLRLEAIKNIEQIKTFDSMVLSDREAGKLIQLPSAGLQDQYKQITAIRARETKVSPVLLDPTKGIPLCKYKYRGLEHDIYLPTYNPDETCLPRVVVAGVGQGKTKGFASNLALEYFLKGHSVITVDCAKGEIRDQLSRVIPPDKIDKVIFLDLSDLDYIPSLDWHEAIKYANRLSGSRLGTELAYFFKKNADPAGDRTRKYLEMAAKTVSLNGSSNPLDILLCLTNPSYRAKLIPKLTDKLLTRDWLDFDDMTDAKRREIYDPVLYRLNMLIGNDAIKYILCQDKTSIDFRKIMDEGYLLVIDVKKTIFGKQGLIDIMSYLMAKIWLATLTRDTDKEYRMCHLILDEPQQWLTGSAYHFEEMVTESRKWLLGLTFLFHSWAQLRKESRELVDILKSAICHYHVYSTSADELNKMSEIIAPYTVEEAFSSVKRYMAINRLRVNGDYETFIGTMLKPPVDRLPNYDNTTYIKNCRSTYGTWYEDVLMSVNDRTYKAFEVPIKNKKK